MNVKTDIIPTPKSFLEVDEASLMPADEVQRMLAYFEIPPLPNYSWKVRDIGLPLTRGEVCAAVIEAKGNLTKAAILAKVTRGRISAFVRKDTFADGIHQEVLEMVADGAEDVISDLLTSDDDATKFNAAKFVLSNSKQGKRRGYGARIEADVEVKADSDITKLLELVNGGTRSK